VKDVERLFGEKRGWYNHAGRRGRDDWGHAVRPTTKRMGTMRGGQIAGGKGHTRKWDSSDEN